MTKLNYLNDTYIFESKAIFLEMRENEKWKAVILNETIFYPQWWWQPADHGEIISGDNVFIVSDVRLDEEWIVWHFWEFKSERFNKWDEVLLKINKDRRILNSKLHSAGHLLDCAVLKLEIENFHATKWYHFSDWPYVEFDWIIENPAEILPILQKNIDDLVSQNLIVKKIELSFEEAQNKGINVPIWKSARVVNFTWFPTHGCWGTHVNSTSEIGKIEIRKIKSNQGKTKIAYSVV